LFLLEEKRLLLSSRLTRHGLDIKRSVSLSSSLVHARGTIHCDARISTRYFLSL
jgi:hypothetical protein